MTIGARVLKTGLAVVIGLWVGTLLELDYPILAAIAAIFTIQPSIYRSWMQVLDQVQSNVLGAIVAVAAVWALGSSPILVGIVSIAVILICIKLKMEDAIGLTLVTVVVIMDAHDQGWYFALDRLSAILTGIASAFVVNVAIAPPRHRDRFVQQIQEAESLMSRLLRTAVSNELKEDVYREEYNRLKTMMRKLDEYYELYAEERVFGREARQQRARLLVVYQGMLAALEKGIALIDAVEEHYFGMETAKAWNRLIDRQIEALCGYHEQLVWKWQGKMKPGSTAAAPPPEATALLSDLVAERENDAYARAKLLVITSAVFTYEDRLRRLDKLMEQWLKREDIG